MSECCKYLPSAIFHNRFALPQFYININPNIMHPKYLRIWISTGALRYQISRMMHVTWGMYQKHNCLLCRVLFCTQWQLYVSYTGLYKKYSENITYLHTSLTAMDVTYPSYLLTPLSYKSVIKSTFAKANPFLHFHFLNKIFLPGLKMPDLCFNIWN